MTFYIHLISTLVILIFRFQDVISLKHIQFEGYLITFILATLSSIIPFFFFILGIRYIGATKTGIIATTELPTTILLAYLFLGESVFLRQILGGALIFSGILLLFRGNLSREGRYERTS